jgi:hypothetical protein
LARHKEESVCSANPAPIASCTRRHPLILAQARYLSDDNYRRPEMSICFPVQTCILDGLPSEWLRIYLFAGLSDAQINKWYIRLLEEHILTAICRELRAEYGNLLAQTIGRK